MLVNSRSTTKYYESNRITPFLTFLEWTIFIGMPILLYISRITGIWFENFAGVTVLLAVLLGAIILIMKFKIILSFSFIAIFCLFALSSLLAISLSDSFGSSYWTSKLLAFIGNTLFVGVFSMFTSRFDPDIKTFLSLSRAGVLVAVFFIFSTMLGVSNLRFFRVGSESNAIALSYSVAMSFAFIMWSYLRNRRFSFFVGYGILGLAILLILGTRQTLAAFIIIGVLQLITYSRMVIRSRYKRITVSRSSKGLSMKKVIVITVFLLLLIPTLLFILKISEQILSAIDLMWSSSRMRWEVFFVEKSLDTGRKVFNDAALSVWSSSPILGNFAYEKQGQWAHNTLIDFLAQLGLLGTMFFILFWLFALVNSFRCLISRAVLSSTRGYFSCVCIALSINSLIVTTNFVNANFMFILFYMAATNVNRHRRILGSLEMDLSEGQ